MTERLKNGLRVLNAQGVLWQSAYLLFFGIICIVTCILEFSEAMLLYVLLFTILLAWSISGALKDAKAQALAVSVADLKDKLCLAEHEAERLRLELEECKASAKSERKKQASKRKVRNENENKD